MRWYQTQLFRWGVLILGGLLLVVACFEAIFRRHNDFFWHSTVGGYFLEGRTGDIPTPYTLARLMLNALLAIPPYLVARAIVLVVALVSLAFSFRWLERMYSPDRPLDPPTRFAAITFTLLLMLVHLHRDLQECGLQLLLLGMLMAGTYALWLGQSIRAGLWFGLAAAYKTIPLLMLGVLAWKRRWKAAGVMLGCFTLLNLVPGLHLGWANAQDYHQRFVNFALESGAIRDIAENGIEPPNPKNQGLMAFFARYLQSYPPGHSLHLDHPAFVQFGNLDHDTARMVAKGLILLLGLYVAWVFRGSWQHQAPEMPIQMAVVCVFCAILSPLCWRHHLVLAVPLAYLLVREALRRPALTLGQRLAVVPAVILIWMPQRELLGLANYQVAISLKPDLIVVLTATLVVLHHFARPTHAAPVLVPETELRRAA